MFLPSPNTPIEAVKGSGVLALVGLFAILPERSDCSYEPTKEELNNEGEGDAGEVDNGLWLPAIAAANGE